MDIRAFLAAHKTLLYGAGAVLLAALLYLPLMAPWGAPREVYVHIEEGSSVTAAAKTLAEKQIIRSPLLLRVFAQVASRGRGVIAGEYYFEHPQNVVSVALRLARGDYDIEPVRVTLPEGATAREMTLILGKLVPEFDADAFFALAEPDEGFLFPDTYFIFPGEKPERVHRELRQTFDVRVTELGSQILAFGKPLRDVVTMAALLEEEAPTIEDRRIIAGILWKRIEMGIPLQVDAVFPYIISKNTYEVTSKDLRVDSPYNTYKYKGLPAGPISNPGLDSILAAVTPVTSNYLYYLSDRQGNFYYSTTYAQHLQYKKKYVDS